MIWTYAPAPPWRRLQREARLVESLAAMTGTGHRTRHHPFGVWATWGGPQWGPMGGVRGPKARRGDVRAAILAVLAEAPMNGYQIIQQVAERSGGAWKPSPGSIYPTLQQLEDEGLVVADAGEGKRTYRLTDQGKAYVAEHPDEVAAPWAAMSAPEGGTDADLRPLISQIVAAVWQIVSVGTPAQQRRGREALADLRRRLHAILAEDDKEHTSR